MSFRSTTAAWVGTAVMLAAIGLVTPDGLTLGVAVATPMVLVSLPLLNRLDRRIQCGLGTVFLFAIILRWICAAAVHLLIYQDRPGLFAPDEVMYDRYSWYFSDYLHGRVPDPEPGVTKLGIAWMIAGCYYLFGHVPFVPKLINGVLGGWAAALTALIAGRLFPTAVARRAGFIAAVMPSMVLWSSLGTKDTSTALGTVMAVYAFILLRERFRISLALFFGASLLFVAWNRPYQVVFVALPVVGSLFLGSRRKVLFKNTALLVVLSVVVLVVIQQTQALSVITESEQGLLQALNAIRGGYNADVGSAMRIDIVDTTTPGGLLLWVPVGLVYFFLAPFPFTWTSMLQASAAPEMFVIYYYIPSAWRGLRTTLRHRGNQAMVLVLFAAISSIGWSMAVTNYGSTYRYRGQMIFVPIIFVALDLERRAQERRRRAAELAAASAREIALITGARARGNPA